MNELDGAWTLVGGRAWDEQGRELPPPYDQHSMGTLMIRDGRMLVALCRGPADPKTGEGRGYSSYGGPFEFACLFLETHVEMTSDPRRVGGVQPRGVTLDGDLLTLRPPTRVYEGRVERREAYWRRVSSGG